MDLESNLKNQEKYIKDNNFVNTCNIDLYCFRLNFYRNSTDYLQQFICYLYRPC